MLQTLPSTNTDLYTAKVVMITAYRKVCHPSADYYQSPHAMHRHFHSKLLLTQQCHQNVSKIEIATTTTAKKNPCKSLHMHYSYINTHYKHSTMCSLLTFRRPLKKQKTDIQLKH